MLGLGWAELNQSGLGSWQQAYTHRYISIEMGSHEQWVELRDLVDRITDRQTGLNTVHVTSVMKQINIFEYSCSSRRRS